METPYKVICLTPVRNEAWILPTFLTAASLWADVIIVADQGSTDGSVEISKSFEKVILIHNTSGDYSEAGRQLMLISAARNYPSPRILVALDADEFLSPSIVSPSWFGRLLANGPGAYARVPFFNVKPGLNHGWVGHTNFIAAWVDNNRPHFPDLIHSQRLPVSHDDPIVVPQSGAVVMHWQFVAPARMRSKHRWYMVWERLNRPERSAVHIYRQYHHMYAIKRSELKSVPVGWLKWYEERGVKLAEIMDDGRHWWDSDVLSQIAKHGAGHFSREAIWSHDWQRSAGLVGLKSPEGFADSRTVGEKLAHIWLRSTQRWQSWFLVRAGDRILRSIWNH
ncbi:MAG: glycosyltransferase family 2 protein [Opitutaceae bacterium]|jgi:hypothetical protein